MSRPVRWPTLNQDVMPCAGREYGEPVRVAATITAPPCDECDHARSCGSTGEACEAFSQYYAGKAWQRAAREPSVRIGRKLRLR